MLHSFDDNRISNFQSADPVGSEIPALKWQYLITAHFVLGQGNSWFEVAGATNIDIPTAKSFYDRGVLFVDTGGEKYWRAGHIPGAVHLSWERSDDPKKLWFNRKTLSDVADYGDEIVFYSSTDYRSPPWETAKAVTWGYRKVYFFHGGAQGWNEAGYPIEDGD